MRRSLAIVLASSLGFAAPAFAQSQPPLLIGQNSQVTGQAVAGQDAMAQGQNNDDQKDGGVFCHCRRRDHLRGHAFEQQQPRQPLANPAGEGPNIRPTMAPPLDRGGVAFEAPG
jgi:hypothetical protein